MVNKVAILRTTPWNVFRVDRNRTAHYSSLHREKQIYRVQLDFIKQDFGSHDIPWITNQIERASHEFRELSLLTKSSNLAPSLHVSYEAPKHSNRVIRGLRGNS